MFDAYITYFIIALLLSTVFGYLIKLKLIGHETYERVEQQGSSQLVSKFLMEMAYWSFRPLANICIAKKISPNQITWFSACVGLVAAIFVAFGHFGVAALLLMASAVMDALDGMVARETGQTSPAGVILDSSLDRYVDFFFLAGLVIYYRDSVPLLIITLLAILGSFMVSYSTAKAEAMQITPPRGNMKRSDRLAYLIIGALLSSISVAYFESIAANAIPMIIVLSLIAVLANYSAFQRLNMLSKSAMQ